MTGIVERLRSGRECGDSCRRKEAVSGCICAAAADEIERLRTALESLTKDPPATFPREPDTDDEVIIKMRAIARAALEGR